jgi:hypothetical protein
LEASRRRGAKATTDREDEIDMEETTADRVVIRDTRDLRRFLLDRMVRTANGTASVLEAKAICNYAQQVYNTINIEARVAMTVSERNGEPLPAVSFDAGEADATRTT